MATVTESAPQTHSRAARWSAPLFRTFPALNLPDYRLLWFGSLQTTFANQMSMMASGYAAFLLTGSATILGLVSSATAIPMLIAPLAGGVVADRASRRTVIMGSQITMLAATAGVAVLAYLGALEVWHLITLGLVRGAAFSFNMPARQAYTGDLVGPDLLRSAVSLQNPGHNFNRVAGPAVAGVVLAMPSLGIGGAFTVMAALYGFAFISALRLPGAGSTRPADAAGHRRGGLSQLAEGVAYVTHSPSLRLLLIVGSLPMLLGMSYQSLLPLFADEVYQVGPGGLGMLSMATGLGALAGSLAIASTMGAARLGILQLAAGLVFGVSIFLFGAAPGFAFAIGAVVLIGVGQAVYLAVNNTLLMTNSEPRLYGRVMSLHLVAYGFMPFATITAGWIADQIGGPATMMATGALVVLVVAASALHLPYRSLR